MRGAPALDRCVPGRGQPDRLGENGGEAGSRDAVQGLVPPVVGGHAEPVDGGGDVLHLVDLLLEGHARDKVGGARLEGEALIEIGNGVGHARRRLGPGRNGEAQCEGKGDDDFAHRSTPRAMGMVELAAALTGPRWSYYVLSTNKGK